MSIPVAACPPRTLCGWCGTGLSEGVRNVWWRVGGTVRTEWLCLDCYVICTKRDPDREKASMESYHRQRIEGTP